MPIQLICCSHSPLMLTEIEATSEDAQTRFKTEMDALSTELHAFAPDLVVMFGPDHFNGFFYDLMPAFCVGLAAEGTHDWGIQGGPLRVPKDLALECARHLQRHDFDTCVSYDMKIDHGSTIPLIQLTGALARYDVLPVFVNCAADPRPSFRRVRALGEEIGRFLATKDLRIAVLGSGGLSHDPPTPRLEATSYETARRLIKRATPSEDDLQKREKRVIQAARDLVAGKGPCMPPDAQWDARFMQHIIDFDTDALDAITDAEIDRKAGFGGHEVRTWVAACAAAHAMQPIKPAFRYYEIIPEWLTGMGIVAGQA